MNFFDRFDEASWEFTYGDECNPELNVLQVGLVGIFHIDEAWRPEKRRAIAEAIERYIQDYGDRLQSGYLVNVNKPEPFIKNDGNGRIQRFLELEDDDADTRWCSSHSLDYVSDYQIGAGLPAGWFEHVHRSVSYVRFYLPVTELKEDGGKERFERLVLDFCALLKPMHGLAGLGIQQLYEEHKFQHLEYEIGQMFNGIDVTTNSTNRGLRNGFSSINWYTFLADEWVEKLGGKRALANHFDNTEIKLLPYEGGLAIRAGEWPELGWVEREPYPDLYVKVNQVLKPVRTPEMGSFGNGSIAGEIRFNKTSTTQWLARFDNAPQVKADQRPGAVEYRPVTAKTGESCPHTGDWGTTRFPPEYAVVEQGAPMPPRSDGRPTDWTLRKRADGGPTSVAVEEA